MKSTVSRLTWHGLIGPKQSRMMTSLYGFFSLQRFIFKNSAFFFENSPFFLKFKAKFFVSLLTVVLLTHANPPLKKNGAFKLRSNPLTTPPYGPLNLFPITSSGVNGAGKSTIERALGLTLEIPHSKFHVDCQMEHTTNGIHFSGRSDDGLVLFDSEGENLSSPADDSALKGLLALLQPIAHIHVANGCLQDSDIQRLEVLAHHLKENRVVNGTRPKGIFFLRTNRRLIVNGKEMTPDEYVTSMIPQSVKDAFDSVECFPVPDDPTTAQQCLSDENFTPENFPKFHTAISRIAEIIRATKSKRPAPSTLTGNELALCLQSGWPSILEGQRAHVPTLREMVVRDRLTGIANSAIPQLEQLAPDVANPPLSPTFVKILHECLSWFLPCLLGSEVVRQILSGLFGLENTQWIIPLIMQALNISSNSSTSSPLKGKKGGIRTKEIRGNEKETS